MRNRRKPRLRRAVSKLERPSSWEDHSTLRIRGCFDLFGDTDMCTHVFLRIRLLLLNLMILHLFDLTLDPRESRTDTRSFIDSFVKGLGTFENGANPSTALDFIALVFYSRDFPINFQLPELG